MNRVKAGRGRRLLPAFLLIFALLLPCPAAALDLEEELGPLFEEYRLTENNFAMGFRSMHDGTEYWYNEDKLFETASLYKLPLNMYFYELEAAGELSPEDKVSGIELSRCHELSLVNSNNEISMANGGPARLLCRAQAHRAGLLRHERGGGRAGLLPFRWLHSPDDGRHPAISL